MSLLSSIWSHAIYQIHRESIEYKEENGTIEKCSSINMVSCEDNILICEDEGDYEMKRCETLNI